MGKDRYFLDRLKAYFFIAACLFFMLLGITLAEGDTPNNYGYGLWMFACGAIPLFNEIVVYIREEFLHI